MNARTNAGWGLTDVLQGVRVVELTHMVAGPVCGQILSDLGAQVLKIEPPSGDVTRGIGPRAGPSSALFASSNRGKDSLFLDLRQPADAARVRELVASADAIVCNIDAVMVKKAGLDAATLRAANPGLVYIDVTGFGAGQPAGTDGLAQANMGLMSVTGAAQGPSFRTGASVVDVSTGVWAALAIIAALLRRGRTGTGASLETSLGDACLYMQLPHLVMHAADASVVQRNGNHSMVSCTPMLKASDGRVMVTVLHDRHWNALCDVAEVPEAIRADARAVDADSRSRHQQWIEEALTPLFCTRLRGAWVDALSARGVPCAAERGYDEVLADPRLWASGALQRTDDGLQLGLPLRADGHRAGPPAPVPAAE